MICGNVSVATIPLASGATLAFEPAPVSSRLWRQLRIGELIEEAILSVKGIAEALAVSLPASVLSYEPIETTHRAGRRRPGPKSLLTDALLREVVVPAYLAGGRRGLQAVQVALKAAGYPGSGPAAEVTNDQARAAVRKSRELGILPPAGRGRNATLQ